MKFVPKLWAGVALAGLIVASASSARQADPAPQTTKWLADGAEFVLQLNIKQIFGSDVMKKGGTEAVKKAINDNADAKKVFQATGIDPTKDLDLIVLSGSVSSPKDVKALLVVKGRFDLNKIQTASEDFAKKHSDELKLVKEDGVQLYQVKTNDQAVFGAFVDASTLVFTPSKEGTLEAVKTAGKKAAKLNKIMGSALAKFNGKESVAMALVVNDELKKALEKAPQAKEVAPKLQSVTAGVTLTDAATTNLTVNTEDAATAKKVLMLLKQLQSLGQLLAASNEELGPIATDVLGAVKMTTEDTGVTVTLKVTQDMIEKANKKDK